MTAPMGGAHAIFLRPPSSVNAPSTCQRRRRDLSLPRGSQFPRPSSLSRRRATNTMSRDMAQDSSLVRHEDQLLDHFRAGIKARDARGVGTEHEKFVFLPKEDMAMLSFEHPELGFERLFERLTVEYGWEPARDGGHIVALERGDAAITLEPGGQLELSGGVMQHLSQTEAELDRHLEELRQIAGGRLLMSSLGLNPLHGPKQIPWMPKSRYAIMRRYMPTRGDLANWMMQATCTIQANFDYTSEEDAADILRSALRVSPLVSALFVASSVRQGRSSGQMSFRGHIWTRTDPDRCGWPAFLYRTDWGFAEYLDYVLDVPVLFLRREEGYVPVEGRTTFRHFIEQGFESQRATMGDFELHLSTVFPEVRLKRYIEVRGADGGPRDHVLALPALWKGILYWEPSRRQAAALVGDLEPEEHRALFGEVYRHGLQAQSRVGSVQKLCQRLVALAHEGLEALARESGQPSEAGYLEPVRWIAESGQTIARRLLRDLEEVGIKEDGGRALIERWRI